MKHEVATLEGALLDAAVASVEGIPARVESYMLNPPKPVAVWRMKADGRSPDFDAGPYAPTSDWAVGGPIIERERITIQTNMHDWAALWYGAGLSVGAIAQGRTPLIAAMRAYVASKHGHEVELI